MTVRGVGVRGLFVMVEVVRVKFLTSLVGSQQRMPKTDRGGKNRNISILFRPMEIKYTRRICQKLEVLAWG